MCIWQSQALAGALSLGAAVPAELGTCMGFSYTASIPPQSMICFPPMKHILALIAAAAAALSLAGPASAHPHVWVTMKSTVVYAPDGTVVGVRHAWTFDDMFSTFA